jgi:hypothetical protein
VPSKNSIGQHSLEVTVGVGPGRHKVFFSLFGLFAVASMMLVGCPLDTRPDTPTANVVAPSQPIATTVGDLPVFAKAANTTEIGGDMNSVDPTLVLGSIIEIASGEIRSFDNVLKDTAKPAVKPENAVVFDNLIDNSLSLSVSWLSFLQGQVSNEDRAEVSVTESNQVTIALPDIDNSKLAAEAAKIPAAAADGYGIVIGYIDYVISAQILRDSGLSAKASGYGAAIGGQWYSKASNTSAYHKLVAIWAPLPFISTVSAAAPPPPAPAPGVAKPPAVSLVDVTKTAISNGDVSVSHIDRTASLKLSP